MTANEAMDIGMKIAEQHAKNVVQIYEMGADIKGALNGCIVSLAADIMKALQDEVPAG